MLLFLLCSAILVTSSKADAPAQTQDPTRPLRIEVGLFVPDELVDDFITIHGLEDYGRNEDIFKSTLLSNYIHGLHETFTSPSIGDLNIRAVITYLKIVPSSEWKQWGDLMTFCQYQSNIDNLDASILIVRRSGESSKQVKMANSAGRSLTDTLGKANARCGVITEDTSLMSAYKRLVSHELGHIIGLIDQGSKLLGKLRRSPHHQQMVKNNVYPYDDIRCADKSLKAIMGGSGDTWSVCSRDRLRIIMGSDKSKVLDVQHREALLPDSRWYIGNFATYTAPTLCEMQIDLYDPVEAKLTYKSPGDDRPMCKFAKNECKKTVPVPGTHFIGVSTYDDTPFVTGFRCPIGYCFFRDCYSGYHLNQKMAEYVKQDDIKRFVA